MGIGVLSLQPKIFAKLMNVAKPGGRVLVAYGAGHGCWLRHFATTVPGYALVDVRPYLKRAAAWLEWRGIPAPEISSPLDLPVQELADTRAVGRPQHL